MEFGTKLIYSIGRMAITGTDMIRRKIVDNMGSRSRNVGNKFKKISIIFIYLSSKLCIN
jgi:hypothetical protein